MQFDPEILDCPKMIDDEIKGSDAVFNADRIIEIFKGKKDTFYSSVCINSAFGIILNNDNDFNESNSLSHSDFFAKALSKSSSIKSGEKLNPNEQEFLVNQLFFLLLPKLKFFKFGISSASILIIYSPLHIRVK